MSNNWLTNAVLTIFGVIALTIFTVILLTVAAYFIFGLWAAAAVLLAAGGWLLWRMYVLQ